MSSILKLNEILDNIPRELEIKGIGTIKVKDPSTEDRINSKEEAKKDVRWKEANESEKSALVLDYLALKIIVDPVIPLDAYLKGNSVTLTNIIDAVVMDYTLRFRKLQNKRSSELKNFLDQMKEDNLGNSTSS